MKLNRILAALLALNLSLAPIAPALANDLSNSSFSETDASNNGTPPNGFPAGTTLPSQVSGIFRAAVGALKRWHNQISPTVTSGGTANAQTLTHTVAKAAYVAGDLFGFIAGATNTGSLTVNVDALGAKTVKIGTASLVGGEVPAGAFVLMGYDGTNLQLLRPGVAGQLVGTNTNSVATTGNVGEVLSAYALDSQATVTITIASPGVVTWTSHQFTCASPVFFTTTGALPTGLAVNTTYYTTCGASLLTNTFQLSTTVANAIAGTSINTSGTQSGTHTGNSAAFLANGVSADVVGLSLTAGDWDCRGSVGFDPAGTTTVTRVLGWINTSSATPASLGGSSALNMLTATLTTGTAQRLPIAPQSFALASTTTMFLGAQALFGTSTMLGDGRLECRRMR